MSISTGREFATNIIDAEDLAAIMRQYPTLGSFGFGCFGQYHREYRGDLKAELQVTREELANSLKACSTACKWLSTVAKSKAINKRHSSYGLKHYVERFYKHSCSNGALIAAAIHLGFECVRDNPNAYFNFDQTSLDRQLVTSN